MALLQAKGKMNSFGKYCVVDFFQRIEFQRRGCPHAHIYLWLDCNNREPVSESMPNTIQLVTDALLVIMTCRVISTTIKFTVIHLLAPNEVKQHAASIYPTGETRVLLPMSKDDTRSGLKGS